MKDVVLDATDRQIIAELAQDGRISFAELGRRVSLSSPAATERVRRLEQIGVITGYRAEIDPRALGYALTAIVRFYMKLHLGSIEELPSVLDRFLLYGETTTSIVNATPVPRRAPPAVV
jgi:Lrp/AsnC family transcriptional regulator, leucine-responsive regulatory protein